MVIIRFHEGATTLADSVRGICYCTSWRRSEATASSAAYCCCSGHSGRLSQLLHRSVCDLPSRRPRTHSDRPARQWKGRQGCVAQGPSLRSHKAPHHDNCYALLLADGLKASMLT